MPVFGTSNFTPYLLDFAAKQDIKNAAGIIDAVSNVVANFKSYADEVGVSEHWTKKIFAVLRQNLG